jgi:hypothetical protein
MTSLSFTKPAKILAGVTLAFACATSFAFGESGSGTNAAPVMAQSNPFQLSPGAAEIVQLTKAKLADDTIIAFVQAHERVYNLTAPEILALRSEGVTDRVITAMLIQQNQNAKVAAPALPQTEQQAPPPSEFVAASAPAPATAPINVPSYPQPSTVTYVQTAPPTTVYVPSAPTYYYAPYYDRYPPVSLSFGFGFGNYYHRGGHYYGGGHYGRGGYPQGGGGRGRHR